MKNDQLFDEQILDMMNQSDHTNTRGEEASGQGSQKTTEHQEADERSIYTGLRIQGKWIYFERRDFAENLISIMLPEKFTAMSKEAVKLKYPSEHRPETILTDESGTVNLLFQYMEGEADSSTIETFRNQVFGMMKYVNSGIKEREVGTVEVEGQRIAYVEFSNNAIGGKLYNLMFYLGINGRPLMGSFNCMTKDMKYWRQAAIEMMQSIRILEKEERA